MIDTPNFFAILPSAVRYNPKLTARAVLLYALLTSLACADGAAYASNKYLADVLDVSERTAIRLIGELEAERYITTRYEYKNDTKEIARRFIHKRSAVAVRRSEYAIVVCRYTDAYSRHARAIGAGKTVVRRDYGGNAD